MRVGRHAACGRRQAAGGTSGSPPNSPFSSGGGPHWRRRLGQALAEGEGLCAWLKWAGHCLAELPGTTIDVPAKVVDPNLQQRGAHIHRCGGEGQVGGRAGGRQRWWVAVGTMVWP